MQRILHISWFAQVWLGLKLVLGDLNFTHITTIHNDICACSTANARFKPQGLISWSIITRVYIERGGEVKLKKTNFSLWMGADQGWTWDLGCIRGNAILLTLTLWVHEKQTLRNSQNNELTVAEQFLWSLTVVQLCHMHILVQILRLYFFLVAQIAKVAHLIWIALAGQLGQSGRQ